MLGQDVVYDRVPYFYSDIGRSSLEYVGIGGAIDRDVVIERGSGHVSLHVHGGQVVGVATLDDAGEDALELGRAIVREHLDPDAAVARLGAGA